MKNRVFLRKEGKGARTRYVYKYKGESKEWKADPTTWKMYKLRESLVESGADENELVELLEIMHQESYVERMYEED